MSMTPRERWLSLLNGKQPDRIPTDYWSTGEVQKRLLQDLNCSDDETLWKYLNIDRIRTVGAKCQLKHHPDDPQAGLWGTRGRTIEYATGTYGETIFHPLAAAESVGDIHSFRWPSPDDHDYGGIADTLDKDDGTRIIQGGGYEPFLLMCSMRGMEQAFADLLLNPEIASAILGHIFDFYYEHNRRIYKAGAGKIDITYIAEDLGAQTGPLFSLEVYRKFILPNQKKMADLARSFGIHIFYHTDGSARQFLPDLVDVVGIEILNPIQWRCPGMEREDLVRDFGDKVIFHGAMDNQETMPFGSVEDVVSQVKENANIFAGRRWICAPCHNLQPNTPTENIVALYETIHELGAI